MCFSLRAAGKAGGAKSAGRAVPPGAQASGPHSSSFCSPPRTFGSSLGEAGGCLRRGRNRRQNKLQGCAEDQEKQVYRQLSPRRGPQLQASRAALGVIKGARTLARHVPGCMRTRQEPPTPTPRAGTGADTEESSIRSVREIRDTQGAGSALERRQRGTRDHGGGCHGGGKLSQARG